MEIYLTYPHEKYFMPLTLLHVYLSIGLPRGPPYFLHSLGFPDLLVISHVDEYIFWKRPIYIQSEHLHTHSSFFSERFILRSEWSLGWLLAVYMRPCQYAHHSSKSQVASCLCVRACSSGLPAHRIIHGIVEFCSNICGTWNSVFIIH